MNRNESIYETIAGVLVCLTPLYLFFTYSGRELIEAFINFIK